MSGADAVRRALLAAIGADALLGALGSDVGGGEQLPALRVEASSASDWSTKDATGREVRTAVSLRVATGQADRLPDLVAAVEAAGEGLRGGINGWRVASAVLLRSASFALDARVRVALVEHRIRILKL